MEKGMNRRLMLALPLIVFLWSGVAVSTELPQYAKAPKMASVAAAYKAKILCSAVFVSKRDPADVQKQELAAFPFPAKIDYENKTVTVTVGFGMPDEVAIFREGLGCTVGINYTADHVRAQVTGDSTPYPPNLSQQKLLWPEGELVDTGSLPQRVDRAKLAAAIDRTFTEPYADQEWTWETRAVVVVYRGRIIGERYAPEFTKDTPLIGWSMTKSITNALVGILVAQGKLSVMDPAPVPEWAGKDDPRAAITLDQLLRMSSGLDFVEVYTDFLSDTPFMLFGWHDAAGFTATKPLEVEPDSRWRYISGSPNLVCRIMRDAIGGSLAHYFAFPRRALFDKIGMRSGVIEPDAVGTFVGSSFSYATARDWARFGLLYLQDGIWEGERILPDGWVKYTTTPTLKAPKGEYGAYWWLNAGNPAGSPNRLYPSSPTDLYLARGYEGQNVIVIPSRELVLVHLGACNPPAGPGAWEPEEFIAAVLGAIKP
jgi:CubicO group peptidase (beta-lactamase class C family)